MTNLLCCEKSQKSGRTRVKQHLLNMTGPFTHEFLVAVDAKEDLHMIKPSNILAWLVKGP